jgi:hypothetical protein
MGGELMSGEEGPIDWKALVFTFVIGAAGITVLVCLLFYLLMFILTLIMGGLMFPPD